MVETYRGGLIMKNYGDLAGIGVKEEWDDWAYHCYSGGHRHVILNHRGSAPALLPAKRCPWSPACEW